MTRRLQLRAFRMAERAAIRRIDCVVAHQAIGHLRHIGRVHVIGIFQASMACCAGIRGIQEWTNAIATPKVGAFVDGGGKDRRDIAELQMFLVTEFFEWWSLCIKRCDGEQPADDARAVKKSF